MGGSHGGFLTAHLMGQHPERFRCAGLRNPALGLDTLALLSDIPDWGYINGWGIEVRLSACRHLMRTCVRASALASSNPACAAQAPGRAPASRSMSPAVHLCASTHLCRLALVLQGSVNKDTARCLTAAACSSSLSGLQEGLKRMAVVPTAEDIARFKSVSPTRYLDRVNGPMLFMLGAKDRCILWLLACEGCCSGLFKVQAV